MALKNANGYGCVYKLSNARKRRNPYGARKTSGWTIDPITGRRKQLYINIGYFPDRKSAEIALASYNENPYDIDTNNITFEEVYEKWSDGYFRTLGSAGSIRTITAAYRYCEPLYNMRMRDIRVSHLEGIILNATVGDSTKARIKSLFNMMYKYALAHDIVEKDYSSVMFANGNPIKRGNTKEIIIFSEEEISKLWGVVNDIPFVDMILIGLYSGWRPQELSILKLSDIDMETETMKGGLKTDAGKNRIVPIHPVIKELIQKRIDNATLLHSEYLFNDIDSQTGMGMTYDKYRKRFQKVMERLGYNHRPHETRHTFITKAKACNVDEYILKLIVGHSIDDITEKTYTHRTIEQLKTEIAKIK